MNLGELPAFGTPFRHTNVPYYDWRLVVYFVPTLSQLDPVYTPHLTSSRSILILSSHLRLGLPSGLFPSGFRTKPLYTPPPPSHSSRFYHPKNIGYRSFSSLLCSFLHSPVTSSLLGPNILLNILFSNTLNPRSSLNVSDQVSHP